jgi:hypothetical protein
MKRFSYLLLVMCFLSLAILSSCKSKGTTPPADTMAVVTDSSNMLSALETADGWSLLWDGKTFAGWKGFINDSIPSVWHIENGMLFSKANEGFKTDADLTLDIVTVDQYENFELKWSWKMTPQGNSGVMFHVVGGKYKETFATGPEYQLLDNIGWPDKLKPAQYTASAYDMYAAENVPLKAVGEWNESLIVVKGSHVEHWLNGSKVVEYEMWTPEWKAKVKASKWVDYPGYGLSKTGYIALQYHFREVYFRNIKIKKL